MLESLSLDLESVDELADDWPLEIEDTPPCDDASTYVLVEEAWRLLRKECRISEDDVGGVEEYILFRE